MKTLSKLTSYACSFGLLMFHLPEFAYAQSNSLACIDRKNQETLSREARLENLNQKSNQNNSEITRQKKIVKDLKAQLGGKATSSSEEDKNQENVEKLANELQLEKEKLDRLTKQRDVTLRLQRNPQINAKLTEISNQKKVISDLEGQANTLDDSATGEDMSLEQAKELEQSGKDSNKKLDDLKDQLEIEKKRLEELEKELTGLSSVIVDSEGKLNTEINENNDVIENQKKVINAKQEELNEATKIIKDQQTSGATSGDQMTNLSATLKVEQDKLTALLESQKSLEKDLAKEKKKVALEAQMANGNLSDFQLYEAAMAEVLIQDKALAQDKELNFEALKLALNNMEVMSTAAAALNHLECKPYGENDSKSYHLFIGASATYVVDQINRVRHFKEASECQISTNDLPTDSEEIQVESFAKAFNQYSILSDSIKKRYEGRQDAMALFQEALIVSIEELTEKTELVGTARENYEKGKEWVIKTAIKLAVTLVAAIIAYNSVFGIIVAIALFALAAVFAVDLVKAVIYRDNWYSELLKGRNHTRLTCNYGEADKYDPLAPSTGFFERGVKTFISSLFTLLPAHVVASGTDPRPEGEFPKFMQMKKDFWKAQSFDASSLLDMDQDALALDTLADDQKTGFSLVETRVVYLQTLMNGLFDPNILEEFMKAYDLTRKNKEQLWQLYSQAKTDLQSIKYIEKGEKEDKKFATKTCLQKSSTGKGKPDLKCDCQKNKSCKTFEFPKFKNLEGQFSPPKKAFVNAVNFTMSGNTEKAQIEKLALRKNAAVLRKKLQGKKTLVDRIRKKQNKRTQSIDQNAQSLLTSFQKGPLSYRQKAEASQASLIERSSEPRKKKETDTRGKGGVGNVTKSPPPPPKKVIKKKAKKSLKFALDGFVDSDEDLEDATLDANILDGVAKFRRQKRLTQSAISSKKKEVKEVNRESELSLFRIISRRYRRSGYPRLLKKRKKSDDKAFSF